MSVNFRHIPRGVLVFFACVVVYAGAVSGQTPSPSPSPDGQASPDANKPTGAKTTKDRIKRWFEFDQLSIASRYHFIENANHSKASNNDQYQFIAKFRFKFDAEGRYSVAANLATGPTFTTLWNATGWGTGNLQKNFGFRQLYFDAKPVKSVEFQIGGLYVNQGESTEATTYDNDNYIIGERLQIRLPKRLYFDEVSVTFARLADVNLPNVFKRFKNFDKQNYHQFLVRKQVNKIVGFSADYSVESRIQAFHEAVKFKLPKKQVIDTFIFENYERFRPDRNYGFNIYADKRLGKMLTLGGGFADIHIKALNADRFAPGKRVYFNAILKFSLEFSLTTQLTQGVGFITPTVPRTRIDVFFSYNILESLKRTKLF